MGKKVTDYLLYRWRYILGYSIIALIIVGLIIIAGLYIPGGISHDEMQSVVASSSFSLHSFDPALVVNLPYHLLQQLSMKAFGVTMLSIKLPSLILAALSALGMILLLQMWFKRNVAVLTAILMITTGQFLFVAQSGTPSIVYVFWSVWLLVAAMMISRKAPGLGLWKVVLFSSAALSLYTPFSLYILIALTSATILHPHLRYLVRQMLRAKLKVAIATVCALLLITPLVYAIVLHPNVGYTLLGVPAHAPNVITNAVQLLHQYFDFITPSTGTLMTPVYGLGSVVLIILGIVRLVTTKYTARSYIISAWAILLVPIILVNPDFTSVTFVPLMLVMGMGVNTLMTSWYRLFPRNPYARIAGLIPLAILVTGMLLSGVSRYVYGYLYDPNIAGNFSRDISLVNHQLANKSLGKITAVVSKDEEAFYQVVAHHNSNLSVVTTAPAAITTTTLTTHDARKALPTKDAAVIITDRSVQASNRLYIYKPAQK
jgi:hypothetical protein